MENTEKQADNPVNTEEKIIPTFGIRKLKKDVADMFNTIKDAIADDLNRPMLTSAEAFAMILNAYVNRKPAPVQHPLNAELIAEYVQPGDPDQETAIQRMLDHIKSLTNQVNEPRNENPLSCQLHPEVAARMRKYRPFIYERGIIKNPDRSQFKDELINIAVKRLLKSQFE
jgi:hypothetical protein